MLSDEEKAETNDDFQREQAKFHKRATLYSYQDTNESLTCLNAYHLGNAVHFTR